MVRRTLIALGAMCLLSLCFWTSCGGGSSTTPPPPAPGVNLSASSLTFSNQPVGTTSGGQSITLTNSGNAALSITTIAVGGTNAGDFADTTTCGSSVAAGANCTITVTFTPSASGSRSASVSITDNASGSPQSVSLSGTGTAPAAALAPTALDFSGQLVGTTSAGKTVTLVNGGNEALTITGITFTGTDASEFSQTNTCGTSVAASGNCSITVTFTPAATGAKTGTLSVADNASGSPQTVTLTGTGTAPTAAFTPATLSFSNELVTTTSAAQTVKLSDTGTAPLAVSSIAITGTNSGDFAETNTCGTSVAVGANCTISVTFTPTAGGARSATLTITDDSGAVSNSTQTVALSGTGTFPMISGTVTKGAVSGATVTVYPVKSDGSNGTAISSGTDTTDSNGNFTVNLTAVPSGPVRVVASGGTYPSEWDGSTVSSSSAVSAILDDVTGGGTGTTTGLSLTAASTFVDANASGLLKSGKETSVTSAHTAAEGLLVGFYGFHSPGVTIETMAPNFSSSAITSDPDGFILGLIVGTLTAEGKFLNSSDPDSLIAAFAADISDGIWDGKNLGGTLVPLGGGTLPFTSGTTDFSSDMGTYVSSSVSTAANGVTTSNASSLMTQVQTAIATSPATPPTTGILATSSGAVSTLSFIPSNSSSSHQFLFLAAHTSGVAVVDVTDPTLPQPPAKAWPQLYYNLPGSGGFGQTEVGGVVPFVGQAGHPQVLAYAYGSKHVIVLNADTLVTGTPGSSNPVDAEMDVPMAASTPASFSGGNAFIGSALPLGGPLLGLATADGYMIFDASQVSVQGGNPIVKLYAVDDTYEIVTENLGADPVHKLLLAGNEAGGAQLVDYSAGVSSGTSYYITPGAAYAAAFPGTQTTEIDANAVDQMLQVGIMTYQHTSDAELINMATITKTPSSGSGVLPIWAPAAGGVAHVAFTAGTPLDITGSAVDPATHLVAFNSEFSGDMAVGQLQDPTSVPSGGAWQGMTDWSFCNIGTIAPSLATYSGGGDPHANGVVFNNAKGTPYGYNLDGSWQGVVQIDLPGFLAIPRAGTSGDAAHQPNADPTTITNTATGGKVMQEINWLNPLVVTSTELPPGNVGVAYYGTLGALGGTFPYTWSTNAAGTSTLTGAGLAMDSLGNITGTPTTVGTYTFTVTVTDSATPTPATATATVMLIIYPPPVTITPASLTAFQTVVNLGTAYSSTLAATGGTTPYTWSITSGSLPTGITINAGTGVISGTPTVPGVFGFTVTVTDSSTPTAQANSAPLSITVNNTVQVSISTSAPPAGATYVGYRAIVISGGTPPFNITQTSGTLPAGLTIDNGSGAIIGVPTAAGSGTVTLSVTDSSSPAVTVSGSVTITINASPNNGELNGQYAFVMSGFNSSGGGEGIAGSFTADGAGNITAGEVDLNDASSTTGLQTLTFTGHYGVGADGRGGMVLTVTTPSGPTSVTLLFAVGKLSSGVATKAHLETWNTSGEDVSGVMEKQDPAAFSTALSGNYVFGLSGGTSYWRSAGGGVFTASGGALSNGQADFNLGGSPSPVSSFTGAYSAGAANGRGTLSLTLPAGTANFAFYVVSASKVYLVSTDLASTSVLSFSVLSGQARAQSTTSFSNNSLSGTSVFFDTSASGFNSYGQATSNAEVGLLTFDGSGGFTLSSDQNNAGTPSSSSFTGTYTVAANGRVTVTGGGGTPPVIYLQAPGQGVIVGSDFGAAFGEFEPQATGTTFTNSTISGNYFAGVDSPEVSGMTVSSGVVTADGIINLTGTDDENHAGTLDPAEPIGATYSVGSTGRVTTSGTGGGVLLYIVSGNKLIAMDSGSTPHPGITIAEK